MSWITTADPLALLAIQAGQVNAPSRNIGAVGSTDIDAQQRLIKIGEPVPIVFARFRSNNGGILISPGASEARFENDSNNNVTAYYHLPLSEGQIDSIPVKDVFQQACNVGSHTQTYGRRAGTWIPGNYIVQRAGKDLPSAPYFCGSIGLYPGISTLSFNVKIPDGFDQYDRQVHLFIRGGMHVTRIYDGVTGPSDNFADLVKWLLVNTSRVPSAMIDNAALLSAATFLEYNGFTCNCELRESTSYADLVTRWAPYFLLGESNNGGKKGLRPLLPVTAAGQIKTTAITPEYVFTDDTVIAGSVEIDYISLADRLPFVAQVIWRQQLESDIGIIRTAEVRYEGTAESGPYETHDLSAFCTSEDHATKVAAYILAKRVYPTHVIRFSARPQAHTISVAVGDIVEVTLERDATVGIASSHSYLYQVERITKTLAGDVSYEATHFPIDSQGRSLIALDVAAVFGTGIVLASNRTGVSCNINYLVPGFVGDGGGGGGGGGDDIPTEEFIEKGDDDDPETGPGDFGLTVLTVDENGGITGVSITDPGSGLAGGDFTGIGIGPSGGSGGGAGAGGGGGSAGGGGGGGGAGAGGSGGGGAGGGSGAVGTGTTSGGKLTGFTITNPGSGFTAGQTVRPRPTGSGSGAAAGSSAKPLPPSGSGSGFGGRRPSPGGRPGDDGGDASNPTTPTVTNPTGGPVGAPGSTVTVPVPCPDPNYTVEWINENGPILVSKPVMVVNRQTAGTTVTGKVTCGGGGGGSSSYTTKLPDNPLPDPPTPYCDFVYTTRYKLQSTINPAVFATGDIESAGEPAWYIITGIASGDFWRRDPASCAEQKVGGWSDYLIQEFTTIKAVTATNTVIYSVE